ncbi:rhodanese-like domain-containing protein [Moheibacter lacus]|uniref:Rhodanese-like domain-containing protein n=1 Tax=Moheibacter lacus TaxID=2745851 RepID=A0A838ZRT6_9FLAO|nr:rhodanese-like domain-containing protein [Moheibacter lacus]MBA5628519.1 rhodanese-like domain-containing protein [Moheibacter lacus]
MTTLDAIKNPNATLIDIREPYELEIDGNVEKAINIPMGEVPDRLDEIKAMPKPIVIFCRSGKRASSTLNFLNENGLEEAFNGGGFADVNEILNS